MVKYKVRHIACQNGKYFHCDTDLVFIKDTPHIVLKWLENPDGEDVPSTVVALDSSKLKPLNFSDVQYLYEGNQIELPDIID